jgi:MFS family permease
MTRFKDLPGNARACIAVEPLWAFFGPMVTYFMPLYQKQLGLDEIQMGLVNSIAVASGLFFYAFAAPITNKLGRRKTSLVFDLISWSFSMIVWALSRNFVWFVVAAVSNSVVRIVIVSWNLLISEDADDRQRTTIFSWINVIGTFGGFATFAGGMIIERFGVIPSMRGIFGAGCAIMTLMFILRYFGTKETAVGEYLKEKTRDKSLFALVGQQLPKAGLALRDPFFVKMTGMYFIGNAVLSIDFFRILYLKEQKLLSSFVISAVPALSAIASIIVFFFILPRQKKLRNQDHLANSFLMCMAAQILFILMPKGSALSVVLIFPSLQVSFALLQTFRDTVFMNGTEAEHKSERFSLIQGLMMLLCIPMGWLAGLLYSISPQYPFILAACLYAAGFLLARSLRIHETSTWQ